MVVVVMVVVVVIVVVVRENIVLYRYHKVQSDDKSGGETQQASKWMRPSEATVRSYRGEARRGREE